MALAETARLIASLELKDKLSPGVASATRSLGTLETRLGRIGPIASRGISTAAANLTKIGLVAGAGLGIAVKKGLDSLAELESATVAADAAIAQMGLTGQVTADQIAGWAQEIETAIGAAFDDKAIVAASTTLIRFGKITAGNLRPALEVIADLATKTGDVDSAATLLAKALADPEKAAGKLARQGIILTKQQQEQIKAMVKAGDTAGAQALILAELEKSTKGAALASQGPYRRALSILADVTEDAQRALAEGFLPVLERLASFLSKKLADPRVISDIRSLGKSLAGAFDKAVTAAQNIPWDSIKSAMKLAGQGAQAALDLFTGLPPWVQTAVLTGWGLNKLTGGAVGGIVSELGKGLIKGVLGMNAGVVNINAAVVNGGGLPTGGAPVGGKGGGILGSLKTIGTYILPFLPAVVAIGASEAIRESRVAEIAGQSTPELIRMRDELSNVVPGFGAMGARWAQQNAQQLGYINAELAARGVQMSALEATFGQVGSVIQGRIDAGNSLLAYINAGIPEIPTALGAAAIGINAALGTVRTAVSSAGAQTSQQTGLVWSRLGAVQGAIGGTTAAVRQDTAVLRAKNMSPRVNVTLYSTTSVRSYMNGKVVIDSYTGRKRAP